MADANAFVHPRKLYATLSESPSEAARAQHTLAFLRACAGASGGFLFLSNYGKLELAAGHLAGEPPADVAAAVELVWSRELDLEPDSARTLDLEELRAGLSEAERTIITPHGQRFELRMLSTYRDTHWVPLGVVALQAPLGKALETFRVGHVDAICNALLDARARPPTPAS